MTTRKYATLSRMLLSGLLCMVSIAHWSKGETNITNDDYNDFWGLDEPRYKHRLRLLFPLLLRVSARLATLVPSVLIGLLALFLLIVFSKKALIFSILALYFSLKNKKKNEEKKEVVYVTDHHKHHVPYVVYPHAHYHQTFGDHQTYEDHHGYGDHMQDHYEHY